MLFNDYAAASQPGQPPGVLAVSQPAHAWISGQLLQAWPGKLDGRLLLAAEQHDVGWLDWETMPSFDPGTGRPHFFRDVGAALHAPMWEKGVDRALAAWGRRVALLISRHGSVIYTRFTDRHRNADADGQAAADYLRRQGALQADWSAALGLDGDTLSHDSGMIAFADTVSLVLCGALQAPLDIEVPLRSGGTRRLALAARPDSAADYTLDPWPFSEAAITFEAEARPLPQAGRFADEAAMRNWLADPARATLRSRLTRP